MASGWSNRMKKAVASLAGSRTVAELLSTSNQEDGATLIGVGPGKKYEIEHKFTRNRRSKGMSPIIKIKEGTREGKLLEPIGVGATGVAEAGALGIAMPTTALGSSRMLLMLIFWEAQQKKKSLATWAEKSY